MTTSNILILKLNSGEEIITEAHEANGVYVCENPLLIITAPDEEEGQMRMGLVPFLPFADTSKGVAIPTNMAILALPTDDLANHYKQKFGKIITPPSQKIITSV